MSVQILSKTITNAVPRNVWVFKRFKSVTKCGSQKNPICSKNGLGKQQPCNDNIPKLKEKNGMSQTNSMWNSPECCKNPCPDYFPRFDELYYESSDKLKRKYQQTWVSCPELQIRQEKITCPHETCKFPPVERRARKKIPKTACPVGGVRICMDKRSRKCARVIIPGCRGGRQPPKCKLERSISDCLKECAPQPCYSECLRKEADSLHPTECKCLNHPMMCEVWAEMRRRMTFVKT